MVVSPSEQRRKTSPALRLDDEAVDGDRRVGAERTGDHGPLRVDLGFLRSEAPGPNEVGDERVVLRELLEAAVPER